MAKAATVKVSSKSQIVLPAEIRRALGIEPGDTLIIMEEEGRAVIMSPEEFARRTCGMLRGTWGKDLDEIHEYLRRERDSWE